MSDPSRSSAAVVREQSSLRILKNEAKGLNQRVSDIASKADCDVLPEYRELGKRLKAIRESEAVKHGEWLPLLQELGIPSQRASEAISVYEHGWKFPECRGLNEMLGLVARCKGRKGPTPQIPGTAGNLEGPVVADAPPAGSGADEPVNVSAPDVGDAAEQLPPGALQDPDGNVLPAAARDAWEAAPGAEKAREHLRAALKEIRAFAATPAGVYVDASHITKRITAAVRQMNCHVLTPENTFRCDGHQGHGCAGEGCSKCQGKGMVPKPLVGDQGPKPKKPWRGRGR